MRGEGERKEKENGKGFVSYFVQLGRLANWPAAPAGWLAKGIRLAALGRPVKDYQTLDIPVVQIEDDRITGAVLRIDRFGNLVTNIDRKQFEQFTANGSIDITVAGHPVGRLVETFTDIAANEVCALFGSTEHLEIAANAASARERLGVEHGAPVEVSRR